MRASSVQRVKNIANMISQGGKYEPHTLGMWMLNFEYMDSVIFDES